MVPDLFFFLCVNGKATSDGSSYIYLDREGFDFIFRNMLVNRIERPGYPRTSNGETFTGT